MSLIYKCSCGASYEVGEDTLGQLVRCPRCRATGRVTTDTVTTSTVKTTHDILFSRHKFLLRQKHLAVSEKYEVWDEGGRAILYIERPTHLFRSLLAFVCALFIAAGVALGLFQAQQHFSVPLEERVFWAIEGGAALLSFFFVFIKLRPRRHVGVYTDSTKSKPLFFIRQNEKLVLLRATYNIEEPDGYLVAILKKNYLFNIVRKRWLVLRPRGELWAVAKEDSILKSLLRRFLGPLLGALRTNFIIIQPATKKQLGTFDRNLTLFDSYTLDMSPDSGFELDRRAALGLGIMLDTGENR